MTVVAVLRADAVERSGSSAETFAAVERSSETFAVVERSSETSAVVERWSETFAVVGYSSETVAVEERSPEEVVDGMPAAEVQDCWILGPVDLDKVLEGLVDVGAETS